MRTIEVEIRNSNGLHARPAASFVKLSSTFKCDISVTKGKETVNGKSIMGLMLLAAPKGTKLKVVADGSDEQEALNAIRNLVEVETFGEN